MTLEQSRGSTPKSDAAGLRDTVDASVPEHSSHLNLVSLQVAEGWPITAPKQINPLLPTWMPTPSPLTAPPSDSSPVEKRWPRPMTGPGFYPIDFSTLPPEVCPQSPTFKALIEDASQRMYFPNKLGSVSDLVKRHTCDSMTADGAMAAANDELQATGDHYNTVIPPQAAVKQQEEMKGQLSGGIGVRLENFQIAKPDPAHKIQGEYHTVVESTVENTPAATAKLQRGDYIVKVNGVDTSKMSADKISKLIQGEIGTKVDLSLIRKGVPINRTLERAKLDIPSVDKPIDKGDGISYIRIRSFNENTGDELESAINASRKAKGFVIDLRDDGGGLMDASVQTSELFIKNGTIMTGRQRTKSDQNNPQYELFKYSVSPTKEQFAEWKEGTKEPRPAESWRRPYLLNGRPVNVLQNGGTASAAEIMLGALHDTAHAETIGDPSFGKGIFQQLKPDVAANATVKVTQGIYKTPSGWWPGDAQGDKRPIQPDVPVSNPQFTLLNTPQDAQLNEALVRMRKKVAPHIPIPVPRPLR